MSNFVQSIDQKIHSKRMINVLRKMANQLENKEVVLNAEFFERLFSLTYSVMHEYEKVVIDHSHAYCDDHNGFIATNKHTAQN